MYKIRNLSKSFDKTEVLKDINLDLEDGKTTCILGASGVGKTTFLDILAGSLEPTSGQVLGFGGKKASFIFQEPRLIPWKDVRDNLAFVLEDKIEKKEIDEKIDEYLELVGLEDYRHYYPRELSGGMEQRISIVRAFIYPADLLLMDEAFKSLDIKNKGIVVDLFKKLMKVEKRTCIMVTHDIGEALDLADRIVILAGKPAGIEKVIENETRLIQDGSKRSIKRDEMEKEISESMKK